MEKEPFNPSAFMGDESIVRHIQRKYAQRFSARQRVLDLGCGVGVFLDLLRERDINGVGVDTFEPALTTCRKRGLKVHRADVLHYLQKTKERFDGVFCSHIVEHLSPDATFELLKGIHRVLNIHGLVILLTPNAKDIEVMTERFWLDVTHVRPYPIPLLEKMIEHSGFSVLESGLDKDTAQRIPKRKPLLGMKFLIKKIRWGEYFGKGDSYVIARKID